MTTQWPIQREKPWSVAIICQFESKIIICHRTIQSTKFYLQIDEEEAGGSGGKKERYFWQYNVQAKGPKGQVILQNISMLCFSLLGPIKLFILVSFRNSLWTRQSTIRTSWPRSSTQCSATMSRCTGSNTGAQTQTQTQCTGSNTGWQQKKIKHWLAAAMFVLWLRTNCKQDTEQHTYVTITKVHVHSAAII